jgi:hypothetical protein
MNVEAASSSAFLSVSRSNILLSVISERYFLTVLLCVFNGTWYKFDDGDDDDDNNDKDNDNNDIYIPGYYRASPATPYYYQQPLQLALEYAPTLCYDLPCYPQIKAGCQILTHIPFPRIRGSIGIYPFIYKKRYIHVRNHYLYVHIQKMYICIYTHININIHIYNNIHIYTYIYIYISTSCWYERLEMRHR